MEYPIHLPDQNQDSGDQDQFDDRWDWQNFD